VLPRVVKNFSGAHLHDDKEKIRNKILLLRPKTKTSFFFTFIYFVAFDCRNKKCCQNVAQHQRKFFYSEKLFQKVFLMFLNTKIKDFVHRGVVI